MTVVAAGSTSVKSASAPGWSVPLRGYRPKSVAGAVLFESKSDMGPAGMAEMPGKVLHGPRGLGRVRGFEPVHLRAEKFVEHEVSLLLGMNAPIEHEMTSQASTAAGRRRHARMVRLRSTRCNHGIGPGSQRLPNQILKLARLVSPERQPRLIVALEQHAHAQSLGESGRLLQRRGKECQRKARLPPKRLHQVQGIANSDHM